MIRAATLMLWMAATLCFAVIGRSDESPSERCEHLFYLTDDGLIILRLQIQLDRNDCHAVWNRRVDAVFAEIDADGDNGLSHAEITSPASVIYLPAIQGRQRLVSIKQSAPEGRMSREQFGDYLRSQGAGPLDLPAPVANFARAVSSARSTGTLFQVLDASGDENLAAEELLAAPGRLRKLDQDDDETLSFAELFPRDPQFSAGGIQIAAPSIASLTGPRTVEELAVRLFKLSPNDLGLLPELIAPRDKDGNGEFDLRELCEFLRNPLPSIEIVVRLGVKHADDPVIEITRIADPRIEILREGAQPLLARGANRLELAANPAYRIDLRSETMRFHAADVDNNGYLDPDEVARLPEFANLFSALDGDGDGKVYLNELTALRMKQFEFSRARATATPSEHGRNLFPLLDRNQDGRISRREFQRGGELIARCDRNGDNLLSETELPSHLVLTVGYGAMIGRPQGGIAVRAASSSVSEVTFGPTWFARMDRNRDGEVSRREFLGPAESFGELDANGDESIEAHEAAAN
jgi:Ca2+-binding EF-hand superfamily protein